MSFGNMNTFIEIIEKSDSVDHEGFSVNSHHVVAKVRAYREGRHGSEKWASRASFTDATDLFRIRVIPGIELDTDMLIGTEDALFEITSIENVRGRGMYIEILARAVKPSGKSVL